MKKHNYWTSEEDNFLKKEYKKLGQKICATYLNRSISSVANRARRIKIMSNIKWTEKELKILLDNKNKTNIEISYIINRSIRAIQSKRQQLRLNNLKLKDNEVIEIIQLYQQKTPLKYIAKKYNISLSYVGDIIHNRAKQISREAFRQKRQRNFQNKAQKIHKNKYKYFDDYIQNNIPININCPLHGKFQQQPSCHLKGRGCSQCGLDAKKINQEEFINRANQIHEYKYDYSNFIYHKIHIKGQIICKKCNFHFEQTPNSHINSKNGCPKCNKGIVLTQKEFEIKANEVHENKYDYSKFQYKNMHCKSLILCLKCNQVFQQTPSHHIYRTSGCPKCCRCSRGENRISKYLIKNNILYETQFGIKISFGWRFFDFYLPNYNLMIEYHGEQHYQPIKFSNSMCAKESLKSNQKRDKQKYDYCLSKKIDLLIIPYWNFHNINIILDKELSK